MKRLYILLIAISSMIGVRGQEHYFLYPTAPANLENFYDRCNYMTEHFWDNCNMKSAFSSIERLKGAFNDYISIAMYAGADTTMNSIDRLIKSVEKNPKNMLTLAKMAEANLFSDTAQIFSEQMYLPFAKAVAANKKVPAADRKYYEHQANVLSVSQVGMVLPDFKFKRPDGSTGYLNDVPEGRRVMLFICDPYSDLSRRMAVRLSADFNLKQLHEKEYLQFMIIYPGNPDDKWLESVKDYPENWIVGASPEVNDMFFTEKLPVTVYLTPDHKILSKDIDPEKLIEMCRILNVNVKK